MTAAGLANAMGREKEVQGVRVVRGGVDLGLQVT